LDSWTVRIFLEVNVCTLAVRPTGTTKSLCVPEAFFALYQGLLATVKETFGMFISLK
jgi:hypothetical protein